MAYKDRLRLYYQLSKPGIMYGNLITAVAGCFLAARGDIKWSLLIYLILGVGLIIGSACAFNNYLDRDLDKAMARTKKRALVTGDITPRGALIYASIIGLV